MSFVIHDIQTVDQMEQWKPVILLALEEIGKRSGGRYKPEPVFEHLQARITDRFNYALWIAVDEQKLENGVPPNDAACGVMTLQLTEDEMEFPVCFISRGWVRTGYDGEPFDAALPGIRSWSRHRNCRKVITCSERSSMSVNDNRFDLKSLKGRLMGLASYVRWVGKRGFRQRETLFEMEVP